MLNSINPNPGARPSNLIRLRNPATGEYLHMSGNGPTKGTDYAWLVTRDQANTIASVGGPEWPYRPVARDQIEGERE